jgi:predicted DNA-binding transcriptional regulator AlpA
MPEEPLLPSRAVCARFSISDRTLDRWVGAPELNFPRPIVIRKRRYWYLSDLQRWEHIYRTSSEAA